MTIPDDDRVVLHHGDCRDVLPTLPDASVDCVFADPPYPGIKRSYGYWTEAEWFDLIKPVVRECRRVLKPKGSAVFILQPNSEYLGKMRLWLFDFIGWAGREWNLVQDVWWWNFCSLPDGQSISAGLLRGSIKACVWLGPEDCHRDQEEVLWAESDYNVAERLRGRCFRQVSPSGSSVNRFKASSKALSRGGVIPFNLLPFPNHANGSCGAGSVGHGAGTPEPLCDWWIRYLTRPGDVVLDPFMGVGTTGLAALRLQRRFVGIEAISEYVAIAERRLAGPPLPLFWDAESRQPAQRTFFEEPD